MARVPSEERDVEASARAQAEWSALDAVGVPVTLVGQRIAHGRRQEQLQAALGAAGFQVVAGEPKLPAPASASRACRAR